MGQEILILMQTEKSIHQTWRQLALFLVQIQVSGKNEIIFWEKLVVGNQEAEEIGKPLGVVDDVLKLPEINDRPCGMKVSTTK